MVTKESIGSLFMRGYGTWRGNLNICIPFLLMYMARIIYTIIILAGVAFVVGVDIIEMLSESMGELATIQDPQAQMAVMESMRQTMTPFLSVFIAAGIVLVLGLELIYSAFRSGAYAMVYKALQYNRTGFADMVDSVRVNTLNMYFASILRFLLIIAGIAFIVPGGVLLQLSGGGAGTMAEVIGWMLFLVGFIFWGFFMVFVTIALTEMDFILVAESLRPVDAIKRSYRFFVANKGDVFMVWLVLLSIGIVYSTIMNVFSVIPFVGTVIYVIDMFVATVVILPLFSIWWMRLYMVRSGKEIYMNDLLSIPERA